MNNYFIIHGSFGSPFVNWFPYLRKEIENKELEVYTPDFPTGVGYQNYDNWEKLLKVYLESGLINENTTISYITQRDASQLCHDSQRSIGNES